jgi:hypothetical protein
MVLAAQEHDSGRWDWEIKPQINSEGLPPDFIGSTKHLGGKVWLDFNRHGIQRLAEQDPCAGYGYIVSLHSCVSMQISQTEREVGLPLFERRTRPLVLT